jgi:prenylcysteine oxidase/farnesylcysteine lyase
LWSINGGNNQLPKKLAINSNANVLLNTYVNSIKYLGPNSFEISATKKSGQSLTKVYNSVIIATPLDENQIDFINFSINLNQNKPIRKYHRTVSTLVAGTLNKKFKGRDVLTDNKNVFFTSIGRLHAVDGTSDENVPVYKVFSQLPLSTEQLNTIFEDIQVVDTTDWLAYPHYDSILLPLPKFILFPGIYHVNAIEWAASAIEMSLIGGKNAALLTFNQMGGKTSNVYSEKAKKQISDEL